ncbi:MAG TPA: LptF/LptG family permease [Pirellulales bacterium]|jgi:lipopolysaccharide export system permease protein|nr:LptF/LptG family permease [Pirellulales bacterium]
MKLADVRLFLPGGIRIIDRYLLRQFVQVFIICWCSLTGLYIVFDAFSNLDEFMRYAEKEGNLLQLMGSFYAYRSIYFFDRTSAVLAMVAAMFTVTWIQRHNELTALMAAGITRKRIIVPVVVAATCVSGLSAANRELIIPRLRTELARNPKDLMGDAAQELRPRYDNTTDILFRGQQTFANEMRIHNPSFLLPSSIDADGRQIAGADCYYQLADAQHPSGYLFKGVTQPLELLKEPALALKGRTVVFTPRSASWLAADQCFVASEVSFEQLCGGQAWRQFSSMIDLIAGLHNPSLDFGADIRVAIHSRVVQPLLDITLLFLGLPLVLSRDNRTMFAAIGLCVVLVAGFMLMVLAFQYAGSSYLLDPALASWMPLMIFAPAAVGMLDRVE